MSRWVRFGYASSGKVHFFPKQNFDAREPLCGNRIKGTSNWTGTASSRESIKGDDICKQCLSLADVPWHKNSV